MLDAGLSRPTSSAEAVEPIETGGPAVPEGAEPPPERPLEPPVPLPGSPPRPEPPASPLPPKPDFDPTGAAPPVNGGA